MPSSSASTTPRRSATNSKGRRLADASLRHDSQVTWVIGMAEHPSGAVLVADVRVTFKGSGVECDMLQKIHPVAPNMACAFAGSVRFGFEMVESLRTYIAAGSWGACPPTGRIVRTWWRHARRAWTQVDAEDKMLGCSLIIAGAQAHHGFVHKNIAYRLRHPKFELERIDREPRAIGSGNQVEAYRKLLGQSGFEWYQQYQQYPQLMQPGAGPLAPFGAILADAVTKNPAKGVSPHLHLCVVRCNDIQWGTNDTTLKNGQPWSMPPVADTWKAFQALADKVGAASETAAA